MSHKIQVLIIDDSAVIRKLLSKIISQESDMEVVGTAPDPYVGRELLVKLKPNVITLDVEMPRMDGITFLEKIMTHMPTPTIIISSLTQKGSELSMRALATGAVSVVAKPVIDINKNLSACGDEIIKNIRMAAKANVKAYNPIAHPDLKKNSISNALSQTTHQILAIASSTGGTQALTQLLPNLPANIVGTVIVQHIPPKFSASLAQRLNSICPFEVREAKDGDRIHPGLALIAPGDYHLTIKRKGGFYYAQLNQDPQEHSVRPAADVLFRSVAKYVGANAIGVVLTGMGDDGAHGLKIMRDNGSYNIEQNEESCVVFGMPKKAISLDAVDEVLHLDNIPKSLIKQFAKREQ